MTTDFSSSLSPSAIEKTFIGNAVHVQEPPGLLHAVMKLADGLELGYTGVDFVVDANLGPVVLEANARPGLNIQVANRRGLGPRLEHVASLDED